MKAAALALILLGVFALGYQGFTYVTREKVVDLGPIEITKEKQNKVFLPPVLGAVTLAVGVGLFLLNSKRA